MASSKHSLSRRAEAAIDELFDRPVEQGTTFAFVARRGGKTIVERYGTRPANAFEAADEVSASSTLLSWSKAKSVVHALIGVLVGDGVIDVSAPAAVSEWAGTDREAITVEHLLEMRSGLRFVEDYVDGDTSHCIEMLFGGTDPSFGHYAATQPLEHAPGTHFNYSSGTSNILARLIGDLVTGATGGDPQQRREVIDAFMHERLFAPAGMTSAKAKYDDAGDFVGSSYLYATATDFARFGELYLHDGVADAGTGARVLPEGWADHGRSPTSRDADSGLGYGRHFWLWPAFPQAMACHGYEGQFTVIHPDRDLVLVHLGKTDTAHNPAVLMRLARLSELLV